MSICSREYRIQINWHILRYFLQPDSHTFSISWPTPNSASFDLVLRPTGSSMMVSNTIGTQCYRLTATAVEAGRVGSFVGLRWLDVCFPELHFSMGPAMEK